MCFYFLLVIPFPMTYSVNVFILWDKVYQIHCYQKQLQSILKPLIWAKIHMISPLLTFSNSCHEVLFFHPILHTYMCAFLSPNMPRLFLPRVFALQLFSAYSVSAPPSVNDCFLLHIHFLTQVWSSQSFSIMSHRIILYIALTARWYFLKSYPT